MGTIIVNGIKIDVSRGVSIINNKVIVDGKVINIPDDVRDVTIEGNVDGSITADGSVTVHGNVTGNVDAGGSVECGDVSGDVDAGGSVRASNITGDIDAGGSVKVSKKAGLGGGR